MLKKKITSTKKRFYTLYKKKRNIITSLIRLSKKDYYASFFEEHTSNMKKTWEGIRNIVNTSRKNTTVPSHLIYKGEIKSSNINMAESMNDFFVNIGNTVEAKIPQRNKHFSTYLKNPITNNIFLNPVDRPEIVSLINQIKTTKACGPNIIPANILKNNANYLSEPLEIILNMSLSEGTFPELMKLANVCPIDKKVIKISASVIDQFQFYRT